LWLKTRHLALILLYLIKEDSASERAELLSACSGSGTAAWAAWLIALALPAVMASLSAAWG
jgi:hypothetical protein